MMDIFISIGFDTAIKKYVLFTEKNHHDLATDYLVYVMMMLTFIYSKADIMNPYLARYKNGASNLLHNLTKYGLREEKVNKFFNDLNNYLERDNYNKVCNQYKNPYFLIIQEDLIDMFYAKWQSVDVSKEEMKKFKNLLYSSKNSNAACRKLNELYNTNLDGALVYYSNIFSRKDYAIMMIPKKDRILDMSVYKLFNLNEQDIIKLNNATLEEINNGIYNYFHINPIGIRAYDKLMMKVNKLSNTKYRLADNTGSINLIMFASFFSFIIILGITIGLMLV
mgnify:FL=1